jgi:hypothetical protein
MVQEGDLKVWAVGFGLFLIFSLSIFTMVSEIGDTYEKDYTIILDPMNVSGFEIVSSKVESDAKDWDKKFGVTNEEEQSGFGKALGFIGGEIFSTAKRITLLIVAPIGLLFNILLFLKVPSSVTSIIMGLIIVSIIFALWRLMKIGS